MDESSTEAQPDRRRQPRLDVSIPVEVDVELEPAGDEPVSGRTINLSLTGMLVHLDHPVDPGTTCTVRFLIAEQYIAPEQTTGIVTRASEVRSGFDVAVDFDIQLAVLDVFQAPDGSKPF